MRPRDWRQQLRHQELYDRPKGSTTTIEASTEEYEHEYFNNDNVCIGRG